MKKMFSLILCVSLLACSTIGCAHDANINGKVVTPYGLATSDEKDPCVKYQVSVGNIVWSCILAETVVVPVCVVLWFLYQPVGPKNCAQALGK